MIAIMAVCAFAINTTETKAQGTAMRSANSLTVDTVVNTGTKAMTSSIIKGYYPGATVQFYTTKISGTVGGTAKLQYSLDGSNWFGVNSDSTYTLTDVSTQSGGWKLRDLRASYLRVFFTGTGTMSNKVSALILY